MIRRTTIRAALAALAIFAVAGAPALARSRTLVSMSSATTTLNGRYTLTIARDREATLRAGDIQDTARLSRAVMRTIERQLAASHFLRLHRAYRHVTHPLYGIDAATLTVGRHRVTVAPGARVPRALGELVDSLRSIALKLY